MATDVVMPQMGESIAEGTIVRWIKKVGDKVDRDEPLFEISTDKVDAEIPSPAAGVLSEIRVKEGETVPVNSVVAVIGAGRRGRPAPRRRAAAGRAAAASRRGRRRRTADRGAPPAAAPRRRRRRRPPTPRAAPTRRRRPATAPRRVSVDRGRDPPALVAARAQDREGAQRRHLADPRHRHRRPGDQGRHPRLHRAGTGSARPRQAGAAAAATRREPRRAAPAPARRPSGRRPSAAPAITSSRCR